MSIQLEKINKPLLHRRSRFTGAFQALLDGLIVILVSLLAIDHKVGTVTYQYLVFTLATLGLMSISYDYFNLYRSNHGGFIGKLQKLFYAWTSVFVGLLFLAFITKKTSIYSRELILQIYTLGFILQAISHRVMRSYQSNHLKNEKNIERVLIVGQGRVASYLANKIKNNMWMAQSPIGMVTFESFSSIDPDTAPVPDVPLLGNIQQLTDIVRKYDVQVIYIVTTLERSEVAKQVYASLIGFHVTVHWVPDIYSLKLINHSFSEVAGLPVLTFSETPLVGINMFVKRVEDIILGSIILMAISPILACIAIAVKLDSSGPIFFRQNRTGWNGKVFRIWKFRSMYVHQVGQTVQQASKHDPRITKVGKWIRRTSLDELPQIFNVLLGDMSLVGPRPHAIQHDHEYAQRIDDYFARHHILPGITGLAQVRGYRGETNDLELMEKRIESDIEYINNWSIGMDILILIRTFTAFTGKNAY